MRRSIPGLSFRLTAVSAIIWLIPSQLAARSDPGGLRPADDSLQVAASYEAVFDQLMALEPLARGATVQALTLERDVARFTLESGTIHQLSPVNGRTVGVVFIGKGRFTFVPPDHVERGQLQRHMKTDSLDMVFDRLVLMFADGTMEELEAQLAFEDRAPHRDAKEHVEYALKYVSDKGEQQFHTDMLTAFLNGIEDHYLYANARQGGDDPIIFEITPYEAESVRLIRKSKARRAGEVGEILCQFPRQADRGSDLAEGARDLVHITRYTIDARIAKNLDFSASVELRITPRVSGFQWVPFLLFPEFEVDSATWGDGRAAQFFWKKENPWLWVRFEPAVVAGEERVLRLHYRGDLIYEEDDWHYLRTSLGWYPRHGSLSRGTFDLTFHYPERLSLVSVGTLQSSDTADKVITARRLTDRPIRNAGFNIGEFETLEIDYPGVPRTTVLMATEAHRSLGVTVRDRMGRETRLQTVFLSGAGMEKQVASDVVSSLSFFTQTFGQPLTERFYATEIPYGHGEAFPGIVHLSWFTFHEDRGMGRDQLFRAHEMAHQWWAIGVDYKTYRDRWLSEGMAQFAALLYFDKVLLERDRYEKMLREWRDDIMDRAAEAGPIALGHRVASSEHPEDYQLIVYQKGAWVVHMLRSMMLDPQTRSDDRFVAMMRDFYGRYLGKRASTGDFRAVVEQHIGMDMGWFFDQWLDGTAIPTYEFSHKVEKAEDGQFTTSMRVGQRDVPDDFKMVVPVRLEFADDQWVEYQLIVSGPITEAELPPFPLEPKGITLNPGEAVLAKVRNVRWKDD